MAEWTETIGAPASESSSRLSWNFDPPRPAIDSGLVFGGGQTDLLFLSIGSTDRRQFLRTSGGADELTIAWEVFASAIVISSGDLSLIMTGPDHADSLFGGDPSQPYEWLYAADSQYITDIANFLTAFANLTQAQKDATTVTLRDELPAEPELTIARDQTTVVEGTDATWTITADTAPSSDLTVNVDVTESGVYIDGTAPTTVTLLTSGDTTETTLTVPTLDDSADEPNGSQSRQRLKRARDIRSAVNHSRNDHRDG